MKTLISVNLINNLNPQFSPSSFLFHFPSLDRESRKFLYISHRKWLYNPRTLSFSSVKASFTSVSATYGGWNDLGLAGHSDRVGESDQFRKFLVSVGIDDRKHVFMFLLGLLCSLAISRVRISSIVVFPASVLVFAIGFSFGFVRSGSISEVSVSGGKRRAKEEIFKVYGEKMKNLVDFFDGLDFKVSNLKNDIKRVIDSNEIALRDLENFVNEMESMSLSVLNARNVVKVSIDSLGTSDRVLVENQKSSRRKKEIGEFGYKLLHFIGGLFGQNLVDSKHNKVRDNVKRETVENVVNDQTQGNVSAPALEERVSNSVIDNKGNANTGFSQNLSNTSALDWDRERRIRRPLESRKMSLEEVGGNAKHIDSEEFSYKKNRSRFVNNRLISVKMGHSDETKTLESHDNLLNSMDFSVSLKHSETQASFVQKKKLMKSSGAYKSSDRRENGDNETYKYPFREERVNREDDSHLADHLFGRESDVGPSLSSMVSDDMVFDRYLAEANDLLQQAKEYIKGRHDEDHAEITLHKSAKVLSKAIAMKPMSLLAVGQLGNTYLLHGELKLKISRELRSLLLRSDPMLFGKRSKVLEGLYDQDMNKDKIEFILVNVCEECEELLVEAGRKYRMALSIDGNDVRALYNWGLALSFRAQLIADIGPEAAFDADKVFLAAIDKFDAMMSRGNVYAPDALFRWGLALQQRSHLRPSDSKEKVKLLQQAKRLYEDALHIDSDNVKVREALSSCISELDLRHF